MNLLRKGPPELRRRLALAELRRRGRAKLAPEEKERQLLDRIAREPSAILTEAGLTPDPWQEKALASRAAQLMFLASRQSGKTFTAAAIALREALTNPVGFVLIAAPSEKQSQEFFQAKLLPLWRKLGRPLEADPPTVSRLVLRTGARVEALPQNEKTITGYSAVTMLVIDEASQVKDDTYYTVRPFLATTRGRLVVLSTPLGQAGWFFDAWGSSEPWDRYKVTADQCPRLSKEFLQQEREAMGERGWKMWYYAEFLGFSGSMFDPMDIKAALNPNLQGVELAP